MFHQNQPKKRAQLSKNQKKRQVRKLPHNKVKRFVLCMTVDTLPSPSPPRSKEVANEGWGEGKASGVYESLLPCKMLYPPLSSRLESSLWTT